MPLHRKAPKDWPPVPSKWMRMVSSAGLRRAPGHRAREHGADGAVDVARHFHDAHLLAVFDGGLAALDELDVQRLVQQVVLLSTWKRARRQALRLGEQAAEVQALGLPVLDALAGVEQVGAADQVVELAMPSWAMIWRTSSAMKKK
jgi:hypothetical protein